jgi:hypothetical protein
MAWSTWSTSRSPATVVRSYYQALADGDAPTALAFADAPANAEYLTSDVLRQQLNVAKLTDVSVSSTSMSGSSATVDVRYRLRFADKAQDVTDHDRLVKHGSTWRLRQVSTKVFLPKVRLGGDRVLFAGRPLTSAAFELFPGALPVTTDSPAVRIAGHPSVLLRSPSDTVQLNVEVSDERKKQAATALDTALARCLDATSSDVLCPLPPDVTRAVPGSLHGTVTKKLTDGDVVVTLSSGGKGVLDINADLAVDASWKAWDFNNLAVPAKGTVTLHLQATAALDDPATTYWAGTS